MTMITTATATTNNNSNGGAQNLGDTSLTKVFVGGLAWETPKEAMRDHFEKYGDILEAVIISDKLTGRSKGYGFVTFKEADAAKKACEDPTPIINGRRANCNLAVLGARRPRSSSTAANNPPPQQGVNVGPRAAASTPPPPPPPPQQNHVQWYYPPAAAPGAAFHHHHGNQHHHQAVPIYGYSPTYVAAPEMNYNHKVGYMNGHFGQMQAGGQGHAMVGAGALMPMYPFYHVHQSQSMGLPAAHLYYPTPAGPIPTLPALISKPTPPTAVCLAVE